MDIIKAVEILEQHNIIRTSRIIGNYYQIYCPFHNDGNEKKPSCGILLHDETRNGIQYEAGWFHCFTCQHAGSFEQSVNKIFEIHNYSQTGTEWLKEHVPDFEEGSDFAYLVPPDLMNNLINKNAVNQALELSNHKKQEYVSEEELASYRFTIPYMYERKLTDKIIGDYDIGFDANWIPPGRKRKVPCITFPVRDKYGNTLFLCRRSVEGKMFHYPEGVTKPLYGIDMIKPGTQSIIICESCINALTAVSYGYQAIATLGTGNSYQMQQLKELGAREFVLCFDGDDAGKRATRKFKKALKSIAFVWEMTMPDGKDANDCSKEEFDQLYSERI